MTLEMATVDVRRPFTFRAGLESGLTAGVLRGPRFRRILHGVYIHRDAPRTRLERLCAAMLLHPDNAFASHASAARVYDLPLPRRLTDEHITVFGRAGRRTVRGVRSHSGHPAPSPACEASG